MKAKDLIIKPIDAKSARGIMKRNHYSGSVVQNSQLHFGAFHGKSLLGALSFGPPMVRRSALGLVEGTTWNGMLELNRMAFHDKLPKNSESRALAVSMRLIKKHYPHVEWIQTYADGTQCGSGTIYRAAGFWLVAVNKNKTIWEYDGITFTDKSYKGSTGVRRKVDAAIRANHPKADIKCVSSVAWMRKYGAKEKEGYQLRYIFPLWGNVRERMTLPVLPYSEIDRVGAGMYKGEKIKTCVGSADSGTPANQAGRGGASPTSTLHSRCKKEAAG